MFQKAYLQAAPTSGTALRPKFNVAAFQSRGYVSNSKKLSLLYEDII